jgi:hypothetical protein
LSDNGFTPPSNGPYGALAARLQAAELVREAEQTAKDAAEKAVTPTKANWKRSKVAVPATV